MKTCLWLLLVAVVAGCALYSDVVIGPLTFDPTKIARGGDLPSMMRKFDVNHAVSLAPSIDAKPRKSFGELEVLGEAELTAGRYDDARRHFMEALDLQPYHPVYGAIAWDLSQLEYMSNNFAASLKWAKVATERGMGVKAWHLSYLESLSTVDVYRFSGATTTRMAVKADHPDVPRASVTINGIRTVPAVIDSGATLSIMSQSLAMTLPVRILGDFEGTFLGLLGEPISVRFGLVQRLDLGRMSIANVPVAIMPDNKMKFLVTGKKEFRIDFLLGLHLLKEFRIELDLRRHGVTFTRLVPSARKPVTNQNLFIEQFRPAVHATINRYGWYLFIVDTGSEVTFLNERQIGALPLQVFAPKVHNATLQGLGGSEKHGEKLENVEIGVDRWAGTFRTIPIYDAGESEPTTGILGENYLKNFDVVIDFGRMRVDLTPIGTASLATMEDTGFGTPEVDLR